MFFQRIRRALISLPSESVKFHSFQRKLKDPLWINAWGSGQKDAGREEISDQLG